MKTKLTIIFWTLLGLAAMSEDADLSLTQFVIRKAFILAIGAAVIAGRRYASR